MEKEIGSLGIIKPCMAFRKASTQLPAEVRIPERCSGNFGNTLAFEFQLLPEQRSGIRDNANFFTSSLAGIFLE